MSEIKGQSTIQQLETRLSAAELAVKESEGPYKLVKALEAVGHGIAAVVSGAKVTDGTIYGYDWAPDSVTRLGLAGAAVDEAFDAVTSAVDAYKGLDPSRLKEAANKIPELSEAQVAALPAQARTGYRALQAAKSAGRFLSAAIVFEAAWTGDYGLLGTTSSDLVRLTTFMAGTQQVGEGITAAKNAVKG